MTAAQDHCFTGPVTLAWVKARCVEEGDCWVWQGGTSTQGYPKIKRQSLKSKSLRRVVVQLSGRPLLDHQPVATSCREKLCLNPAHLFASSAHRIGKTAAHRGSFSGEKMRTIRAVAARNSQNAKLTMEIARLIRASTDSGPVLAKRYGVHRSLILRVRQGKVWRDTANPFFGLGARP